MQNPVWFQADYAVSQTWDTELAFSQHGKFWKRTTRSSATSGSPFLPLLLLWIVPHQLHKMHFHIQVTTNPPRLTREKEQREIFFFLNFPKGWKVTGIFFFKSQGKTNPILNPLIFWFVTKNELRGRTEATCRRWMVQSDSKSIAQRSDTYLALEPWLPLKKRTSL